MSSKNLSTVATDVIEAYGITATNVINAYRFGGERLLGYVDVQFATAMTPATSAFGKGLRTNLVDGQQRVSGFAVKGLHLGSDGAQRAVGVAVDLATKGVDFVASNAVRLERATNVNAIETINRVAMPAVALVSQVAERLEEGSTELVKRVAGKRMPAKAVATRRLNAATRKAAATRKQAAKTAKAQVAKAEATRKRVTRSAARRVGEAVAQTATETSNAARRVARKAKATAEAVA